MKLTPKQVIITDRNAKIQYQLRKRGFWNIFSEMRCRGSEQMSMVMSAIATITVIITTTMLTKYSLPLVLKQLKNIPLKKSTAFLKHLKTSTLTALFSAPKVSQLRQTAGFTSTMYLKKQTCVWVALIQSVKFV